jgi:hypothetical protein
LVVQLTVAAVIVTAAPTLVIAGLVASGVGTYTTSTQ